MDTCFCFGGKWTWKQKHASVSSFLETSNGNGNACPFPANVTTVICLSNKFTLYLWRVYHICVYLGQQQNHKLFHWCFIPARCRQPDLLCNLDDCGHECRGSVHQGGECNERGVPLVFCFPSPPPGLACCCNFAGESIGGQRGWTDGEGENCQCGAAWIFAASLDGRIFGYFSRML